MSTRRARPTGGVLGPLGRRVAAGSLAIALGSIAVLVTTTLLVLDFDLGSTGREQEGAYTSAIASSLRSAFLASGSWGRADMSPAAAIARLEGIGLAVRTAPGAVRTVVAPPAGGQTVTLPLLAGRRALGDMLVTRSGSGLSPAELSLRHNLVQGVAIAAVLAALLALSAAIVASRRLVAPLRILTEAAARLGAGDRSSRVGPLHAPGELGQLAQTFDTMAADLEQEDALRRALVADVAHELRTPLAVLRAQLAAVSEGLTDFSPETVDSLTEEVDRLSRLVDDVGVLAAAQSARLGFERHPTDLAATAAVAAERLAPRFAGRRIHLVVELEGTPVVGDAGRLEQAVVNLLSNAEKYSPADSQVRLRVHRNGSQACVSVSDEGPGIRLDEQERIFERFYRGAASRATTSGSGIGLAVVAEVIAAHGGSVGVESVPGHGSTFWLALPLAL